MRIENPKLVAALPGLGVQLNPGTSLSEHTSLGIGGKTDLLRITRHEAIPDLLNLLDAQAVPHKFLGGGSNLLVGDGELPWVVLQLVSAQPDIVLEGNFAQVDAAADGAGDSDEAFHPAQIVFRAESYGAAEVCRCVNLGEVTFEYDVGLG